MWSTIGLAGGAVGVAVFNTLTTVRLWRSATFDRSQKVAQTAIIWLLPGSFIVTRFLLSEPRPTALPDPTIGSGSYQADPTALTGHHGHDGGHDGGW
jgi:hypothetical protein